MTDEAFHSSFQSAAASDGSVALAKHPKLSRERARCLQWLDSPASGRQLLEGAIQGGGWANPGLWWELVALMEAPEDYQHIRELWLHSPEQCHDEPRIMRAVARAAAVAGQHSESQALLRKLIVTSSQSAGASGSLRSPRHALASFLSRRVAKKIHGSDQAFAKQAAESLRDLDEAFSQIDLDVFLISGTLLGLVREGAIIGWDKDIDVGFFSEKNSTDLNSFFRQHRKFRVGRVDLHSKRIRVIHRNGTWIDVFPHYMENGRRWHDGTATRWWNTPFGLKKVDFLGVKQHIPDDPELYLQENYGNWQVPVSNFDARIDAPNAEVSDPEHFASLLYFSLEKSIRTDDKSMKERYVNLLREQGEGRWLNNL